MTDFLKIRQYICTLLQLSYRGEIQNDSFPVNEDEDIDLILKDLRGSPICKIVSRELKTIIETFELYGEKDGLGLSCFDRSFETAITVEDSETFGELVSSDSYYNITDSKYLKYTISHFSETYCVYLISLLCECETINEMDVCIQLAPLRLDFWANGCVEVKQSAEIDWKKALWVLFSPFRSLQIVREDPSNEVWHLNTFQEKKNAYLFTCLYNLDARYCPTEYHSINELFHHSEPRSIQREHKLPVPCKKYNNELVGFYKTAISSSDPFVKYISFYHVLEYFFAESFDKHMIEMIRSEITLPDFSYYNDSKLLALAKKVQKEVKINADETQGNELETLKYVLQQYVTDLDKVKKRIKYLSDDDNIISYYQDMLVPFVSKPKAKKINWNDSQQVQKNIADRIYQIRNALVHSKKENNGGVFNPVKDIDALKKELPLIRTIAEEIIINSSELN